MQSSSSSFGKGNWKPRTYLELMAAVVVIFGAFFAVVGIGVSFFHNVNRYQADLLQLVGIIFLILLPIVYKALVSSEEA